MIWLSESKSTHAIGISSIWRQIQDEEKGITI